MTMLKSDINECLMKASNFYGNIHFKTLAEMEQVMEESITHENAGKIELKR